MAIWQIIGKENNATKFNKSNTTDIQKYIEAIIKIRKPDENIDNASFFIGHNFTLPEPISIKDAVKNILNYPLVGELELSLKTDKGYMLLAYINSEEPETISIRKVYVAAQQQEEI